MIRCRILDGLSQWVAVRTAEATTITHIQCSEDVIESYLWMFMSQVLYDLKYITIAPLIANIHVFDSLLFFSMFNLQVTIIKI